MPNLEKLSIDVDTANVRAATEALNELAAAAEKVRRALQALGSEVKVTVAPLPPIPREGDWRLKAGR